MSYNTKENWRDTNEFETIIKKIYFINIHHQQCNHSTMQYFEFIMNFKYF